MRFQGDQPPRGGGRPAPCGGYGLVLRLRAAYPVREERLSDIRAPVRWEDDPDSKGSGGQHLVPPAIFWADEAAAAAALAGGARGGDTQSARGYEICGKAGARAIARIRFLKRRQIFGKARDGADERIRHRIRIAFVALLWALAIFNFASVWFGFDLRQYGIIPRTSGGLWGIPLHVFIHANFGHLAANSVPLLILGGLASFRGRGAVFALSAFIALVGGSLVWLLGRTAVHIGASGLVFGYFGYLAARAFYQPGVLSILIAVVVIFFYGWTILFGVLPTSPFCILGGASVRADCGRSLRGVGRQSAKRARLDKRVPETRRAAV